MRACALLFLATACHQGAVSSEPDPSDTTTPPPPPPLGSVGPIPSQAPPAGIVVCEAIGGAKCLYVAPSGDDSNPGTYLSPFKRPQIAALQAAAGDFIYLRGGTYNSTYTYINGVYPWGCSGQISYAFIVVNDALMPNCAPFPPSYAVASGTANAPITVRSYPGERAVLDATGLGTSSFTINIGGDSTPEQHHWVFDGLELKGAPVHIWGGNGNGNAHDIVFKNNYLHAVRRNQQGVDPKDNVGLLVVNRADWGGAYNIFIDNNELYDLAEIGATDWRDSADHHSAAITTLSCLPYISPSCVGTGSIYIRYNLIHDVPAPFFFKNAAPGPMEITGNVIYNAHRMGQTATSNVTVQRNLFFAMTERRGFGWGEGMVPDGAYLQDHGRHYVIEYNTFVDFDSLGEDWSLSDHLLDHNILFGMQGQAPGGTWDTASYITKTSNEIQDNPTVWDSDDPAGSVLQNITSDNNCFISPFSDFSMAHRNMVPPAVSNSRVEHYTPSQALTTFGYDPSSVFVQEADPAVLFVDPGLADYRLRDGGPCAGMGAY